MIFPGFRKANNKAIAGFLLPFLTAALASLFVIWKQGTLLSSLLWLPFVTIIPLLLLTGLYLSIRSIPLIDKRGDRDYAIYGLVLNLFFLLLYIFSLIYRLWTA